MPVGQYWIGADILQSHPEIGDLARTGRHVDDAAAQQPLIDIGGTDADDGPLAGVGDVHAPAGVQLPSHPLAGKFTAGLPAHPHDAPARGEERVKERDPSSMALRQPRQHVEFAAIRLSGQSGLSTKLRANHPKRIELQPATIEDDRRAAASVPHAFWSRPGRMQAISAATIARRNAAVLTRPHPS